VTESARSSTPRSYSIVIPSRDRPARLRRLLESIAEFADPPAEKVVVIDDSPRPEPWPDRFPGLRIDSPPSASRRLISQAKNEGLARVTTPLVLFIDDDNRVGPGLVRRLVDSITTRPRLGALMPAVRYASAPNLVWVYATPFAPGRWSFELIGRNRPRNPGLEGKIVATDALPNACLFRTEAIRSVDGFDVRLGMNSSADMCQRLKQAGWEAAADTGAFIDHDVEPPDRVAYWVEHQVSDPTRMYYEIRDWFEFQYRVHRGTPALRWRATYHALRFVLPLLLGLLLRRDARTGALLRSMVTGYSAALRRGVDFLH
jgi:GT2 family glycosyltransferase